MPLTPSGDGKSDQENHDSDATDDVRHHGNEPGNVARVSPDEADNYSRDDHGDRRSEPVENPSSGDDVEPTLVGRSANRSQATDGPSFLSDPVPTVVAKSSYRSPETRHHGSRDGASSRSSDARSWPRLGWKRDGGPFGPPVVHLFRWFTYFAPNVNSSPFTPSVRRIAASGSPAEKPAETQIDSMSSVACAAFTTAHGESGALPGSSS